MEVMLFATDGAATTGYGVHPSGETAVRLPYGVRIVMLRQQTGAAGANDANWTLWTDYKSTGQRFLRVSLLPASDGGVKLGPTGIRIRPGAAIQFAWDQAVAQANNLEVYYEKM